MINSKRSPESAKKLIISDIPTQYRKLAGDLINSASLSIKDQVNHIEDLLVKSNNIDFQCVLVRILRENSKNNALLIHEVLSKPNFLNFLLGSLSSSNVALKFEISWALINFTSIKVTEYINESHIKSLVNVLDDGFHEEYVGHIIWTLGNLASDDINIKNLIISLGAFNKITQGIISKSIPSDYVSYSIWCLSNCLKNSESIKIDCINRFLYIIPIVIENNNEQDILEMLWGISYITESLDFIDKVCNVLHINFLLKQLRKSSEIKKAALRILLNISNNIVQTESLIAAGGIDVLINNLYEDDRSIIRESLITLSNIACNSESSVKLLINNKKFGKILKLINSIDCEVLYEALFVILNTFINCSYIEVLNLMKKYNDILSELIKILEFPISGIIQITLNILDIIFSSEKEELLVYEKNTFSFIAEFTELGGVDILEKLLRHEEIKIYQKSLEIIKKYWEYDEVTSEDDNNFF